MSTRLLPEHIPGTVRAFRRRKRREWNAVIKAFKVFHYGCAFTNLKDAEVGRTQEMLDDVKRKLSPKVWGR